MEWYSQYWGLMPLGKMSKTKLNRYRNRQEFINLFETYFSLTQDQFSYEGLPDTCDERFIERSMILYGQAMIAKLDGAYISPACANGANISLYGYPLKVWGWGLNGFNKEFSAYVPGADDIEETRRSASGLIAGTEPQAVVGYDNVDRYPYINYIYTTAQRLADLIRACDTAVQNLKSPMLIRADESQKKTIEDMIRARNENDISIAYMPNSVTADNFQLFPFNMDHQILSEFWQQYRNIEAQFFEIIGYNANADTDKRERLLVDEVNANNERISANLNKRLHQRELWCERINKVFGLNVSVHLRKEDYQDETDDVEGMDNDQRIGGSVSGGSGQPDTGSDT